MALFRPPKAPAMPLAPVAYLREAFDNTNRALRLYFNQLDGAFSTLFGPRGGRFIDNPYGAFQNSATQALTLANTPYVVALNTTDFSNGVTLASNQITVDQSGIYNVQFSLQFENTATHITEVFVWLRKNGVDIPGTASEWAVTSVHGSIHGYMIGACNFYVGIDAGEYIELVAVATDVGLNIEAYTASTSPFTRPSVPASVVTVSFVSAVV